MSKPPIPAVHSILDLAVAAAALTLGVIDYLSPLVPSSYALALAAVGALLRAWYERTRVAPALACAAPGEPGAPSGGA